MASVSSGQTTLKLIVGDTSGTQAIDFYSGAAGYTVTYTPSAGTASNDAVTNVVLSSNNHSATLTLASAVANGGVLNITAKGTNPAAGGATESNEMTVAAWQRGVRDVHRHYVRPISNRGDRFSI